MPVETFGRVTKTVFSVLDSQTAPYPDVASVTRRWALDCIGLGGFVRIDLNEEIITTLSFDMGSVSNPMSKYSVIYNDAFAILRDPIQFLFPSFGKLPAQWFAYRRKAVKASDQLRQLLTEIIEKRKKEVLQLRQQGEDVDSHSKDLLTMLIEANLNDDDEKVYMTDSELISNLSIFYAAGHETTANAVSSMLYYLATHPDIQTKLRDEVISIMGDVPEDVIPTDEQLRKMTFLECCIKETMRINPPTSGNQLRFAAKDTTLGDFFIPEGTSMQMDLWILHHMDKYWKDPDTFNPYRFDSKSADYVDTTWMPFGSGERICIGMNFSLAEQRVMHAMFVRKYIYSLPHDSIHSEGMINAKATIGFFGPDVLELQLQRRY
ncbi:hypothetical protein NQZ79_g5028 [Umbelopsis isabellina]|nr:hypothetical protein NQZ79_g5028 [Umbelopsis isabellina]